MVDLATVVAELYSLLAGEFTAARNKQAKELGRSGDKELAKQVRQLPKPSTSAWLVNMLVARRREEIDEVLQLGASLRQAQEDLDQKQMKELTDQRHRLLASVVKGGRELADELGQKVSGSVATEVEQTLRAAMADTDAADAAASGQLTRSLSSTGWEAVDLSGAVAVPEAVGQTAAAPIPSKRKGAAKGKTKEKDAADSSAAAEPEQEQETSKAKQDEREAEKAAEAKEHERRKEQAQAELEEAERRVEEAESEQEATEKRYEEAVSRQEQLEEEITDLKKRLRKLERESKDADREIGSLEDEKDDAARAAKDARREGGRARRRLNDFS